MSSVEPAIDTTISARCVGSATQGSFVSAHGEASAEVKRAGAICVDAKKLADVIKAMPPGDIRFQLGKSGLEIKTGKSRSKMPTLPADEFPPLPDAESAKLVATIKAEELGRLITQGAYATCTDISRPHMCVALLEQAAGRLTVMSVDGHRVAMSSCEASGPNGRLAISPRGLGEIRRLIESAKGESVSIYELPTYIAVTVGSSVVTARLGEAESFPPVRRVIPQHYEQKVTLPRELLIDAVKRASLVSAEATRDVVRLVFSEDDLVIESESETGRESNEGVSCDASKPVTIGCNGNYLSQALSAFLSDEIVLELSGELDPIKITAPADDGCTAVCMPVRM